MTRIRPRRLLALHALLALLTIMGTVVSSGPAGATPSAPAPDGDLVVWSRAPLTQEAVAALEKECWLIGFSQDLAVIWRPASFAMPAGTVAQIEPIGIPRQDGHYYLYLVEDAAQAGFQPPAEVLARSGHTVVLWSPDTPRLTAQSRRQLQGVQQPVRLDLTPSAWRSAVAVDVREPAPPRESRTDFHPLVDAVVADCSQAAYVARWQVLDDFETRYYNRAGNEAASQWMYDEFVSFGLTAEFHEYNHNGTRRNVVGTLPGLVHPDQVVYITGHFDSISEDYDHAPGADDNASGTTAFLEAARVLSQYAFEYTIKFAGFNSEEQGLIGSAAYVAHIASQGENVVGCINLDMIAYRGTDPAPPDLILYTNTASQDIAHLYEDACLEYFPNDLEPIVLVEAISASDHASFWNHGYQAILAIEEEAWGGDFCPWYHTSQDRIEQYPQDYPTHCATAAIAAAAQLAAPMQPDTPYLTMESFIIDDDATGASQGNGNGVPEYGETIELTITLGNLGQQDGTGISGLLGCDDEFVTLLTAEASFGTIPAFGGTGSNTTPFVFSISADVPDLHELAFSLTVNAPPEELDLAMTAYAPDLRVVDLTIDDTAGGNGNGIPEAGEDLVVGLTVANAGSVSAPEVNASLDGGAFLTTDPTPQGLGTLEPDGVAGADFAVSVAAEAPELYSSRLWLTLLDAAGYDRIEEVLFNIGDLFADDIEDGGGSWDHYAGGTGFGDEWHVDTYRNHTYGGNQAWKCGGAGAADYGNLLYAVLESSPFTLPAGSTLTFWHWIDAETSSAYPEYAYDGGLVEISIDGGPWETLTPEGGYPHLVREGGTPGPFDAETPIYSGSHDWAPAVFDLSGYEGSARVRFAFGSDGAATEEGWYIDDLQLILPTSEVGADPAPQVRRLHLSPAQPNPARTGTTVRLSLPTAQQTQVRVFDLAGRLVQTLHDGMIERGDHAFAWEGRGADGHRADPGVYFIRVQTEGTEQSTRVFLIR